MDSQKIAFILGEQDPQTRRIFGGVLPRDHLCIALLKRRRPGAWVVNTDPCFKKGKHWFALFLAKGKRTVDFFDSYCQPPAFYGLSPRLFRPAFPHHEPLQGPTQRTCGHFVITYLSLRARGVPAREIVHFLAAQKSADATVVRFVRSMYEE